MAKHHSAERRQRERYGFYKTVTVDTVKRVRYGRELGKVLASGKDVNLEHVPHMHGITKQMSAHSLLLIDNAENEFKTAKLGLLAPVSSWEWRYRK